MDAIRLGVNVDHVASLRQARGTTYPDPVFAAYLAELAGASQITVHLREDRRHIQERDLEILRRTVSTELNLEMAATKEITAIACQLRPDMVTLVPERRQERTTERGLSVVGQEKELEPFIERLRAAGIRVSLFVDPEPAAVKAAVSLGVTQVELHTGYYVEARGDKRKGELERLRFVAREAKALGLLVAAGHGLDYSNVRPICMIPEIHELNIGHAIICRAVFCGIEAAVREMLATMAQARLAMHFERPGLT